MWTHKAWPGRSLPATERLRSYAGWCNAVEGNTTFYATPSRETVAAWAEQTDPDFRFVLKLPKAITHERRLTGADQELRAFLHAVEPLGPRAAAFWIQLPASFAPADIGSLQAFLRRLPTNLRYAVEVRHPAFFTDPRATSRLEEVLTTANAEWVPFDTTAFFRSPPTSDAEREAWSKKPRLPLRTRALTDQPIVRYLGRDAPDQTIEGWQPWLTTVTEWLREGRSPTVFIHTPNNAEAPTLARHFHKQIHAQLPALTPLPTPTEPKTPTPTPKDQPLTLF